MRQRVPVPDLDAPCRRLLVEDMARSSVSLLGAGERYNQVQLGAGIDHPSDAAENTVHFSERAESIDVDRHKAGGLRKQIFVCHFAPPGVASLPVTTSCGDHQPPRKTQNRHNRAESHRAKASDRAFARGRAA